MKQNDTRLKSKQRDFKATRIFRSTKLHRYNVTIARLAFSQKGKKEYK